MPINVREQLEQGATFSFVGPIYGGVNLRTPSQFLEDVESPILQGCEFTLGRIKSSHGYREVESGLVGNRPIGIVFPRADGSEEQLVLTDEALYKLDGNVLTRISAGFSISGSADILPSWDVMPSADMIVFTNGVDTPFRYDGTDLAEIENLPGATFTARGVVAWKNHLFFYDTTEDGTRRPYRLRRSDVASPGEWVTGLAGFNDLLDESTAIVKAAVLGVYLILYRAKSIVRADYLAGVPLIDFEGVISCDGPRVPNAIVATYQYHVFVGMHGVYYYEGGNSTERISSKIERTSRGMFPPEGVMNNDTYKKIVMSWVEDTDTIYILIPNSDPQGMPKMFGFAVHIPPRQEGLLIPYWILRDMPRLFTASGQHILRESVDVDPLQGAQWGDTTDDSVWPSWDDIEIGWSTGSLVGEVFVSALTSDDDSVYTFTSSNPRLEEDTDWFYQTRRFGLEDRQIRINYIIIAYQGGPFRVEYKINDGPCTLLEVLPYSADLYTAWIPRQLGLVDLELIFRNSPGNTRSTEIHWYGMIFNQEFILGR